MESANSKQGCLAFGLTAKPNPPAPDARLYGLPPAMSVGHADGAPAGVVGVLKQAVAAITEKVTS